MQLLQQIEKWKKPSVLHLVGNMGHMTVQAEIGKYDLLLLLPFQPVVAMSLVLTSVWPVHPTD